MPGIFEISVIILAVAGGAAISMSGFIVMEHARMRFPDEPKAKWAATGVALGIIVVMPLFSVCVAVALHLTL